MTDAIGSNWPIDNERRKANAIRLCALRELELRIGRNKAGEYRLRSSVYGDDGDVESWLPDIPRYLVFVDLRYGGIRDRGELWTAETRQELEDVLENCYANFAWGWYADVLDLEDGIPLEFTRKIVITPVNPPVNSTT